MDNNTLEALDVTTKTKCGTRAGYIQHYKRKEEYCEPCIRANRVYQRSFREKRAVSIENRVSPTLRPQCGTARGSDFHYYHGEHPCEECKTAYNQRSKDYYEGHPEKAHLRNSKWRIENPEKFKESSKKWRDSNPEKIASKNRHQRAVKAKAISERYTSSQVLALYGIACHICNEDVDLNAPKSARGGEGWELGLQLDHVVPLSKGGSDVIENIRPSHAKCNLVKRATVIQ